VLLLAAASAPIAYNPDDIMDSPRPKASLAEWTGAPGREKIALPVAGAILRGYSYAGSVPNAPVLVMFGGRGNLVKIHDAAARSFARHASRVIWYDYRGYGFSGGAAHFEDFRADALSVYDATLTGSDVKRVIPFGYSMGTAIADYVALNRPVSGLILAAPWRNFMTYLHLVDPDHDYRLTPRAASDFDEGAMVQRINAPLLVFQGTRDEQIPPTQGPELERAAASTDKRFVPIYEASHAGLLENPQSQSAVAQFLTHLTH
jgi:pimeloyl-ACP methyl ester carboxylesterase